jgi:hypothetical protein
VDRFGETRTRAEHHAKESERRKPKALGVKLVDGQLQPVALVQSSLYGGAFGLLFQGRADGAKSFEDGGLVGVVLVSDRHVGKTPES